MRGRPPLGAELVEHLAGSPQAKKRLAVILRTLSGELTIPQACTALGIGPSRFHELRTQILQRTLEDLEPKPMGRPAAQAEDAGLGQLKQEIQSLKIDLRAAQIREELALMLPHVLHPDKPDGRDKKKSR